MFHEFIYELGCTRFQPVMMRWQDKDCRFKFSWMTVILMGHPAETAKMKRQVLKLGITMDPLESLQPVTGTSGSSNLLAACACASESGCA